MRQAPSRLQWLFALGLAMAVTGFAMILIPDDGIDSYFQARLGRASYGGRARPVVLIDEAHGNMFTAADRLLPLVRLLREDGYFVGPNLRLVTNESLRGVSVFVVSNPRSWLWESAFSKSEMEAVHKWVEGGGSLLVAIDAGSPARAASALMGAFGVGTGGSGPASKEVLLLRGEGKIPAHAITDGGMRVERLMCFGWQSLTGAGIPFLQLGEGRALGVTLEVGKGRVAVLGNAVMITALRRDGMAMGFNRGGNDNVRLTLNLLHWLSRL